MAQQVCVVLSTAEREQLAAIVADRNRSRKHVERAGIVLASADRHSAQQVAQRIGVSRPTVWRWQQRFAESGIEGLLRDKTRKPGKAPIAAEITARVVALTCTAPPHQATHWTGRAMAKAIGISVGSVQRVWRAHKLPLCGRLSTRRGPRPCRDQEETGAMTTSSPVLTCFRHAPGTISASMGPSRSARSKPCGPLGADRSTLSKAHRNGGSSCGVIHPAACASRPTKVASDAISASGN
jgi:transposase